jgi:hypothetical protein
MACLHLLEGRELKRPIKQDWSLLPVCESALPPRTTDRDVKKLPGLSGAWAEDQICKVQAHFQSGKLDLPTLPGTSDWGAQQGHAIPNQSFLAGPGVLNSQEAVHRERFYLLDVFTGIFYAFQLDCSLT